MMKSPSARTAWADARALIWPRRHRLLLGLALMLVERAASFVLPATAKILLDEVIGQRAIHLLVPLTLAAAAATAIQALSSFTLTQLLGVAAQRVIAEMRRALHRQLLRQPVRFFDATQSGVLVSRLMADTEAIQNLIGVGLVTLIGGAISAVAALAVLFYLNWRLTIAILVVLAPFAAAMAYLLARMRPIFLERAELQAVASGRLVQTFGGIRIVKAYSAERREHLAFVREAHRLFRNRARSMTGAAAANALSTVTIGTLAIAMVTVGGSDVLAGRMTAGELLTYAFFVAFVAAPLAQTAGVGTQMADAFASLDRIRALGQGRVEEQPGERPITVDTVRGEVRFEHVWFAYETGKPVLRDICFDAHPGTMTALIGPSGAGKTTMLSLLMAFSRPREGRIVVDGHDLSQVSLAAYRAQLGVVLQDSLLFDGTVADNIRYARPRATMDDVRRAARMAHCDEFVERFADGYQTVIGERGVRLSSGQRQRVAIARAILADPRILILDEATASLDVESDALVQDALRALSRDRTSFVIAHRLSTIRDADQILLLEQGRIVERGTHEELYRRGGRYRHIYQGQDDASAAVMTDAVTALVP